MTTPSVDRPVSEPMTGGEWPETFTAAHLEAARAELSYERAEIVVADLLFKLERTTARALPLPRRYTGGPLEDGLYLWKAPHWSEDDDWASSSTMFEVRGAMTRNGWPFVWLIGPIHIPDIPSEEASS